VTSFFDKLNQSVDANNSLLSVGLDPVADRLPSHLQGRPQAFFEFNTGIIDATKDIVCAYKPNSAFYEAHGPSGIEQLKATIDYIHEVAPHVPIILDAKRGDIGNTNEGYLAFCYDYLNVDAVTLHPYMGGDSLQPFLARQDKGAIIMCRNSNPGAGEFQDLDVNGAPLYEHVARQISDSWNTNNNCVLVVGATAPSEMKRIREIVGEDMIFLVPGIGAQGGDIEASVKAGLGANNRGIIMHSGRDIMYASSGEDFAEQARTRAVQTRDDINTYR